MNINELLKDIKNCKCGKSHSCDIKTVIIKSGATNELPTLVREYHHILLVADNNTYDICGKKIETLISDKIETVKVFTQEGLLIPNENAIDALNACVTDKTDLIVGVGSGVINDLCKYVSFNKSLRYFIVATAPSMDGYASAGAAMITNNMKTTFDTRVPAAIIGDVDILKEAPLDMIKSGFGDIIGKYSALNDWKLANIINGEYICDFVYDMTYDTVIKTQNLASGVKKRDPDTVKTLMEGLVIVGIAMAFVGNSRPASGSEHHMSHYFEITGIVKNRGYLSHGIDVAYSTVKTQQLREKIINLQNMPENIYTFDKERWTKAIQNSYGYASDGVIALQNKTGYYTSDLEKRYREKWNDIIDILKEVPSSDKLCALLNCAGMDYTELERFYGKDIIDDAVLYAKDLKDRYTVLWLYFTLFAK